MKQWSSNSALSLEAILQADFDFSLRLKGTYRFCMHTETVPSAGITHEAYTEKLKMLFLKNKESHP